MKTSYLRIIFLLFVLFQAQGCHYIDFLNSRPFENNQKFVKNTVVKDSNDNQIGYLVNSEKQGFISIINKKGYVFSVNVLTGDLGDINTAVLSGSAVYSCSYKKGEFSVTSCSETLETYHNNLDCSDSDIMEDNTAYMSGKELNNNLIFKFNGDLGKLDLENQLKISYVNINNNCYSYWNPETFFIPIVSVSTEETGVKTHYSAPFRFN